MTAQQEFTRLALKQHPLSAAYPSMLDEDVQALSEDIAKHGQREKGVLLEGMVLDGWHRYRACYLVGVEFETVEYDGADPAAFVESKNDNRRHMTASQRAESKLRVFEWRDRGKSKSAPGADQGSSTEEIAKAARASTRTVEQAKAAHRAGLGDEVLTGTISAKTGAELAKLSPKKRDKAVKAIKEGKPPAPLKEKKADPRDAEIKKLRGAVETLNEEKVDLADTARELNDKLTAFETTDPDEQQKEIQKLQKRIVRLEAEIERLTIARNDAQNKNNELIRQVKLLQRKPGGR